LDNKIFFLGEKDEKLSHNENWPSVEALWNKLAGLLHWCNAPEKLQQNTNKNFYSAIILLFVFLFQLMAMDH